MRRKTASAARFYEPGAYTADESVGWLMKRVTLSIVQEVDRRLVVDGITMAQWGSLFMLCSNRAGTVAELARELHADPGATTRLLDRLEAKGLLRRERCTEDRRVVRLALTDEGRSVADRVPVALTAVLNEHLAGFTKTEWNTLKDYLRRMLENGQATSHGEEAA